MLEQPHPISHFYPSKGWSGDPNGLVYKDGIWHLSFQYEPKKNKWTPSMHWGHTTSTDLIHWTKPTVILAPDSLGSIYSGSAIIDVNNTAGFGENTIICIYTSAGGRTTTSYGKPFTQSIAYSYDGEKYNKYNNNPILTEQVHRNRDPKVFWHEETQQWIMVLFMTDSEIKDYGLFSSSDLLNWKFIQKISLDKTKECPDMFCLNCAETKQNKWIFMGPKGHYVIGDFDGNNFTYETNVKSFVQGNSVYSSQTWNNVPNNRIIQIYRMDGSPISQMSVPIELSLKYDSTHLSHYITSQPADEYLKILKLLEQSNEKYIANQIISIPSNAFYIDAIIKRTKGFSILLKNYSIIYHPQTQIISCYKLTFFVPELIGDSSFMHLRIVFDTYSIEFFGNDGEVYAPLATTNVVGNTIKLKNMHVKWYKIMYL